MSGEKMQNGEPMPTINVVACVWTPTYLETNPSTRDGGGQVNVLGDPYWMMRLETGQLSREEYGEWVGFIERRMGRRYTFLAPYLAQPTPLAGGVVSDSGVTITGYNRATQTVSLLGVGNYTASPGDMVSYYTANSGYFCAGVVKAATATAEAITLTLGFPPRTPHPTTPGFRRINATAEFELLSHTPLTQGIERRLSLTARQVRR